MLQSKLGLETVLSCWRASREVLSFKSGVVLNICNDSTQERARASMLTVVLGYAVHLMPAWIILDPVSNKQIGQVWSDKIAQWAATLAWKSEDLNLIAGSHMIE